MNWRDYSNLKLKSSGKMTKFIEALNIAANEGAISSAASLRSFGGILSCPADFYVFIMESNL